MRNKASNQNRFMRFITIPIRVLIKAKDFYVRSITDCSEGVNYGNMVSGPGPASLPKSFSVNSSRSNDDSEDLRQLIRAASTRSMGNRVDLDLFMQEQMRQSTVATMGPRGVPRSCSVGMGKIDEDKACDFGEDNNVHAHLRAELFYPRSKSYAVTKRSVLF